ncbi:MAG: hypothetical protein IJ488_08355 [Clostridia bacterium]|nr:hypothetical protein [Clostridia bacterium]
MRYSEELIWILDEPKGWPKTLEEQDKAIQIRKAFVHSLGLKCDFVGWCKMDLSNPRASEILNSISEFCKENGWRARGLYTRKYLDVESDWYELVPTCFKDNTLIDRIEIVSANGNKVYTWVISAYHELSPMPKMRGGDIYVPERFRKFCIQNYPDELDFCWVRDKGKYEAEQYFHVYGKHLVPQIAVDYCHKTTNAKLIADTGGWLPKISNILHELQQVNLQDCYLSADMPDGGIAYAYIPSTFHHLGRYTILLHKDIAQSLLQQKILPSSALRPAPVFESLPGGYSLHKTEAIERPEGQYMSMMLSEYEKLKNKARPVRTVSEKDALKILRINKRERKEDFAKALPKSKSEALLNTGYSALIPYYSIADGCFLSDEYEFLSSVEAIKENEAFQERLSEEELLEMKPEGVVFGRCSDGDVILLCNDGKVVRISHEEPVAIEQWPTPAQFFADTVNE